MNDTRTGVQALAKKHVAVEPLAQRLKRLSTYTVRELDTLIAKGGFIVAEGVACDPADLPELAGGWALKATRVTVNRSVRNIYIIATTFQAGTVWACGQRKIATNAGLTKTQALVWCRSRNGLKHMLLPYLVTLLNNAEYAAAHREFSYDFTVEQYEQWVSTHPIRDRLLPQQRKLLVDLWLEYPHSA